MSEGWGEEGGRATDNAINNNFRQFMFVPSVLTCCNTWFPKKILKMYVGAKLSAFQKFFIDLD